MGARSGGGASGGMGSGVRNNTFAVISGGKYGNITVNKNKSVKQLSTQANKLLKNMKNRPGGTTGKEKSIKTIKAGVQAMKMAAKFMRYS